MSTPSDPLDSLLDRWRDPAPHLPNLQAEVWQRIATEEMKPTSWRERVEGWFNRPAFATGFVAGCALLGLLLAELHVSRVQHERSTELVRSYLLLIDPLLNAPPERPRP